MAVIILCSSRYRRSDRSLQKQGSLRKAARSSFSIPWNPNYIAENINSFIGQYTQSNQPDHGFAYLYYFVGKQEKSQAILNTIMNRF